MLPSRWVRVWSRQHVPTQPLTQQPWLSLLYQPSGWVTQKAGFLHPRQERADLNVAKLVLYFGKRKVCMLFIKSLQCFQSFYLMQCSDSAECVILHRSSCMMQKCLFLRFAAPPPNTDSDFSNTLCLRPEYMWKIRRKSCIFELSFFSALFHSDTHVTYMFYFTLL